MDSTKNLDKNANKGGLNTEISHGTDKKQKQNAIKTQKKFPYPACWNDSERMDNLFSPFRLREVNPEDYDSKMKFWQDMISLHCTHAGTVIFSELSLQMAFVRGDAVPYGLEAVIEELSHTKKIRLRNEYEYDPINTWRGWAMNGLVWRPLAWGVGRLKATITRDDNENMKANIDYIHLEMMRKFCKELETKVLEPKRGSLMHFIELKKLVKAAEIYLTDETLKLCMHTLHCQKILGLDYKTEHKLREIHIVKIPAPTDPNGAIISEVDHAVHNLQMTQANLVQQLEDIESEIGNMEQKVRQLVKENKRQIAKNYLHKKHLLEKNHEKRSQALQNIEALLISVDEARGHGEILDAYKIGSRALKNVLNNSGLKYDDVDEVIDEVRETLETQRELQDTISSVSPLSNSSLIPSDNDELERELKSIMGEQESPQRKPKAQMQQTTIQVSQPRQVTITDTELLAMLDELEVEDTSISSTPRNIAA